MKRKHLESALSSVQRDFPDPKILLEQYPTSAELTASVVLTAMSNGDLGPGKTVLDLGCGTGMLTVGCALLECDQVIGFDCDDKAIAVAKSNVQNLELQDSVDFVMGKVNWGDSSSAKGSAASDRGRNGAARRNRRPTKYQSPHIPEPEQVRVDENHDGVPFKSSCFDTVLMNPPFGTKHNKGIDVQFLRCATRVARRAVYSFHKTSTREYLIGKIKNDWDMEATVVAEMKFDIPNTYKFHQRKSVDVAVDLLRIGIPALSGDESQF